jgi:ribosomal protein S18 acetylase RimI-like enzyme
MKLRTLVDGDLDDALALWARTEHLGAVPRTEVEALMGHDGELVLAALEGGDDGSAELLVGVVLGSFDGRRGWIQRLAVDPPARRRGVGAALVAELERRLAVRGCVQVNLLVHSPNEEGRAFWARRGYQGSDDLTMYRRRLDDSEPAPYGSPGAPTGGPDC